MAETEDSLSNLAQGRKELTDGSPDSGQGACEVPAPPGASNPDGSDLGPSQAASASRTPQEVDLSGLGAKKPLPGDVGEAHTQADDSGPALGKQASHPKIRRAPSPLLAEPSQTEGFWSGEFRETRSLLLEETLLHGLAGFLFLTVMKLTGLYIDFLWPEKKELWDTLPVDHLIDTFEAGVLVVVFAKLIWQLFRRLR